MKMKTITRIMLTAFAAVSMFNAYMIYKIIQTLNTP